MGDGRYYSPEQFFSVIYLTIFVVMMTIRLVQNLYKGAKPRSKRTALLIDVTLLLLGLMYFLESILVYEHSAYVSRVIASVLFVMLSFLLQYYWLHSIVGVRDKYVKGVLGILVGLTMIFSIIGLLWPELMVTSYSYATTHYGLAYSLGILIGLLGVILMILMTMSGQSIAYTKVSKWFIGISLLVLWLIPISFYAYMVFMTNVKTLFFEYMLILMFAVCISLISNVMTPYHVSTSVFSDVRTLMLDYVFITDEHGQIIYRNDSVNNSQLFVLSPKLNVTRIHDLFVSPVETLDLVDREMIVLGHDRKTYLSFTKKEILKHNQIAGYIITFSDMTYMIELLNELEMKELETQITNDELSAYKEIVYEVEKDKEINYLLTEVARNQQASMKRLRRDILELADIEQGFIEAITDIIKDARNDLQEVRKVVTTYRTYYGGEL